MKFLRAILILIIPSLCSAGVLSPARGFRSNSERGLAGWWLMNEGTGNLTLDLSGNANHGTLQGDTAWAGGRSGSALTLDGTGDYVEKTDDGSLDITGEITLSAWVYVRSQSTTGGHRGVVAKYRSQTGATNQRAYELYINDDTVIGGIEMTISDDGTFKSDGVLGSAANAISLNSWHHISATFVPSTYMRLYVDGVQVAEDTTNILASIANTAAPLWIGLQFDSTNDEFYLDGLVEDVRVYNRALAASEFRELYLNPNPARQSVLTKGLAVTANPWYYYSKN